jgi:dipeptidyl aminopeptidase/acylaminoacyl peptidase
MKKIIAFCLLVILSFYCFSQTVSKRAMKPADVFRFQAMSDLQVSPEGNWLAYTLSTVDSAKDKSITHIWMSNWDGSTPLQLTNGDDGDATARWSPDGKYLSFISSRQGSDESQLWLIDRRGGEGQKLLQLKGKLTEYAWSPDGKKIVLVINDPDYADTAKTKIRKPFVIDRFHFKQDIEGYLDNRNTHLFLYDMASKKTDTLTRGIYKESSPSWNPAGTKIAFVANRTADPDRNENDEIWVVDAKPGAEPKSLTTWKGEDTNPVWSPDGKNIAYLQSTSDENFTMYGHTMLAVIPAEGGTPKLLSQLLDRPVRNPKWSKDGQSIVVIVSDDRQSYPVLYNAINGTMKKLAGGDCSYSEIENRSADDWAAVMSTPQIPAELYALQNGNTRRITHIQDSFLAPIYVAKVEGFKSKSKDGTIVSGILYKPADAGANKKLPLLLYIHGGPVAQDEYEFDFERQMIASGGYAVAAVNYRGSNGRGVAYCRAIYSDWGNKEVMDIKGVIDYLVEKGIADSAKMGIMGWSYGGILTDYMIASDTRFKAASSGAGSALQLSMYGVDEYANQYNNELGTPWTHLDKWLKVSYPFLKADRIHTPTLFIACQSDFNVPSVGAEQMYQALRTLNIPTQLVIYPGQFHEITVPSYQADRFQRWLVWFDRYLK